MGSPPGVLVGKPSGVRDYLGLLRLAAADGDLVLRDVAGLPEAARLAAGLLELTLARSFFRSAISVRLASLASRRSALRPEPMSL